MFSERFSWEVTPVTPELLHKMFPMQGMCRSCQRDIVGPSPAWGDWNSYGLSSCSPTCSRVKWSFWGIPRIPHFQMNPNHCWWHSNVMGGFSHKLRRTMERVRDIVRVRKGGLGRVTSTKGLDMFDDSDLSLYPHEYGHRSIRKASLSVMKTRWFGWSKTSLAIRTAVFLIAFL